MGSVLCFVLWAVPISFRKQNHKTKTRALPYGSNTSTLSLNHTYNTRNHFRSPLYSSEGIQGFCFYYSCQMSHCESFLRDSHSQTAFLFIPNSFGSILPTKVFTLTFFVLMLFFHMIHYVCRHSEFEIFFS